MKFAKFFGDRISRLLVFIFVLSLLPMLLGCKSTNNESLTTDSETFSEPEHTPVTLDLVLYKYSEETNGLWLGPEGIKTGFKNEYPWIDLNIRILPWEEAKSFIDNDLKNNGDVDIFLTDEIEFYAKKDLLAKADEFIPEDIRGDFHPLMNTEHGIPFAALRRMLFLNNNLVLGLEYTDSLTRDYGGFLDALRSVKENRPDIVPLGLDFSNEGGYKTYLSFFNSIGDKDAVFANFKIMKDEGLLGENPADSDLQQNLESFANEKTAMIFAPENCFKMPFGFSASMMTLPGNKGLFVYDSFAITKSAAEDFEKKEAIKDFFYYLYGPAHENYLEIEGFSNVYLDNLGEYKPYPSGEEISLDDIDDIVLEEKNILK